MAPPTFAMPARASNLAATQDFRSIDGVLVPACHRCISLQVQRNHDPNPTSRGIWWCSKCLDNRCDEIFDRHKQPLNKLLDMKMCFIDQIKRTAAGGTFDDLPLNELQREEALQIQVKIARVAGIRDAYLLQANYGQYLDFQEPRIMPTSKEGEFLITQWRESREADEIWKNYPRWAEVGHAYVEGINEGYLRQWRNRARLPGGQRHVVEVVTTRYSGIRARFARVREAGC